MALSSVEDELEEVLRNADEKRDFDALVRSLNQLMGRINANADGSFILPSSILSRIAVHFSTFSSLSAVHWSTELSVLLNSEHQQENSKIVIVMLLCSLVDNVPLLNANKFRAFIKNEITIHCVTLWRAGHYNLASTLTLSVMRTLMMELSYLEAIQSEISHANLIEETRKTWNEMLCAADILKLDPGAFLYLSLLLFHSSFGMDYSWANLTISTEDVVCRLTSKRCANGRGECGALYCASLFALLSVHLATFCQLLPDRIFHAMFEFLIVYSQGKGNLEGFLQQVARNPNIRYGEFCERVFQSISALLLHSSIILDKIWAIDCETKKDGRKKNSVQRIDEKQLSWDVLLSLSDECLAESLTNVSNAKVEEIVLSANFEGLHPKSCLHLLNSLAKARCSLLIPLRSEFIELMLAEETPKSRSLEFSARLLEMHARTDSSTFYEKSDFVSFCLALFQPISQLDCCEESVKREFLLAELYFIRSLFFLPQLLISFAPLIVQLLPDFFVLSNFYRKTLRDLPESRFADRFEHSLTSLCREIVRRKKCFNKLLPFVISSSLTGERELCFPMYLLFSALNENDFSLLSTNLSAAEKRKFSHLKAQFYASNKIIG